MKSFIEQLIGAKIYTGVNGNGQPQGSIGASNHLWGKKYSMKGRSLNVFKQT